MAHLKFLLLVVVLQIHPFGTSGEDEYCAFWEPMAKVLGERFKAALVPIKLSNDWTAEPPTVALNREKPDYLMCDEHTNELKWIELRELEYVVGLSNLQCGLGSIPGKGQVGIRETLEISIGNKGKKLTATAGRSRFHDFTVLDKYEPPKGGDATNDKSGKIAPANGKPQTTSIENSQPPTPTLNKCSKGEKKVKQLIGEVKFHQHLNDMLAKEDWSKIVENFKHTESPKENQKKTADNTLKAFLTTFSKDSSVLPIGIETEALSFVDALKADSFQTFYAAGADSITLKSQNIRAKILLPGNNYGCVSDNNQFKGAYMSFNLHITVMSIDTTAEASTALDQFKSHYGNCAPRARNTIISKEEIQALATKQINAFVQKQIQK